MTTSQAPVPHPRDGFRGEGLRTLLVAGVGFAFGLLYLLDIRDSIFFDVPMVDAADYHQQAREIAAGGSPMPHRVFYKPPLYPYFLSWIYRLFGTGIWAPLIAQALMGGFSAAILYRISRRWLTPGWSLLATGLFLFYAPLAFFQGQLLIVSLYLLLSLACLLLLIRAGTEVPDPPANTVLAPALGAGVLWGLAVLARPTAFLWGLPLGLWLARPRRGRGLLSGTARTAVFVTAAFLVVLPVTLRNHRAEGVWVPVSYNGGINFYIGNNPRFEETLALRPGLEWEELAALPDRLGPVANSAEYSRAYYRESFRFFREDPVAFLENWGRKLLQAFSGYRIDRNLDFESYARDSLWLRFSPVRFVVLGPLALCGLVLAWRRRWRPVPIGLLFAGNLAGLVLFFVTERYRVAALPAFAFFAALGLRELTRSLRTAHLRALLWPGALLVGSALLVIGDPVGVRHLDYARPGYDRAQALARKGRLEEARDAYRRAAERHPESPDIHFRMAELLGRMGDADDALSEYALAAAAAQESYKPHRNIALLLMEKGEDERAERALDRALELKPGDEESRAARATLRSRRQDWAGALLDMETALGAPARSKEPLALTGTENAFGRFVESIVPNKPSEKRLQRLITYGRLLGGAGETRRALAVFEQARAHAGHAPPALLAEMEYWRGELLLLLDQNRPADQALAEAERLWREAGVDPPLGFLLARGEVLCRTEGPEAGIPYVERALESDPQSALAHYALACAHALSGESEEALQSLARAVDCGFRNRAHAMADPDLASLRGLPRFQALLRDMDDNPDSLPPR